MARKSGNVKVRKSDRPATPSASAPAPAPAQGLQRLQEEVDRLFEDFAAGWPMPYFGRRLFDLDPFRGAERALAPMQALTPSVDISETDKELRVTAELPGIAEKDIEVVLSDDVLTIKGEKREEEEEKNKDYYVTERRYGSFHRAFRLPDTVDKDKIDASFDQGVLTIRAPKTAKAKSSQKRIKVKRK